MIDRWAQERKKGPRRDFAKKDFCDSFSSKKSDLADGINGGDIGPIL